ncbi:MAG: acetyl-CoA acyltransferase 2 [Thermoproteota archaeon]|jgi:acetyl-CoA acyltransferase 2
MTESKIYLVAGKRTPFGKFGGSLQKITPVDLAVYAGKAVLEETKVKPDQIDHVVFGNVCPSTTDTIYGGRHLALKLGCPQNTPGYVVNRLCGSGIQAILDAFRMIKLGEANCILSAGSENMSMIPHLVYGSRFGTKYGSLKTVDLLLDTLTDKFTGTPMGITAENLAQEYTLTREECDEYSLKSHQKAAEAYDKNLLQGEIVAISEGRILCERDEHVRYDAEIGQINKLRSTFIKEGTVTAASASGIVDGACVVMVASEKFVKENNLTPLAEIVDGHVIGVDPDKMGIGPVPTIQKLLERNELTLNDIDLVEINEAFAPQVLACAKALELDHSKLNIWGGAVAIGHPLAATGTRISLTLARQLKHTKGNLGVASACIGGGQGISLLLKSV